MLYDSRKSNISRIERESGVKFEHLSAPQPADVAKAAGVEAIETINQISDRYTRSQCCIRLDSDRLSDNNICLLAV